MLKKFFISLLGTVAGIWVAIGLLVLSGFVMLMSIGMSSDDTKSIRKHSVLVLSLDGNIEERESDQSLASMLRNYKNLNQPTLDDMLTALSAARDDDRIEALYIDCKGAAMGFASREELIEAIADFRTSGKPVYAYADTYRQGDYMVAAATADSLYLNPMGALDLHGIASATPFFAGLLEKVGVKMQIVKVGTFKSAVEPFILKEMSAPARTQMQVYLDSIWNYAASVIAEGRDMAADKVHTAASEILMCKNARAVLDMGLVSGIAYRRQVEDMLAQVTGADKASDIRWVNVLDMVENADFGTSVSDKHVAVYYCVGDIVDSGEGGIVGDKVVPDILALADDENVAGLVLRVNSGGGSAFASEQIWEALQYFKSQGKPFYVSMGDYAASGGYYISCGADKIFADRTTLTGSIGVFGMIPDFSGLVTDKLGVNFSVVETNPNAQMPNPTGALSPAQHDALQVSVDDIYETFTGRVAAGRDMPQDSVKSIAEGRVWVGCQAIRLGLVDEIGSLETARAAMLDELGLDSDAYVAYPLTKTDKWMKMLMDSGGLDDLGATAPALDAETLKILNFLGRLKTMNPVQARMEEIELH